MQPFMYQASVSAPIQVLRNLSAMLDKGAAYAARKGMASEMLARSRLYPDDPPLLEHVQVATHAAKECAARLTLQTVPYYPRTETTVGELKIRIQRTCDYLKQFRIQQFQGSDTRMIYCFIEGRAVTMAGSDFLFGYIVPHFHLHVAAVYCILRNRGVELADTRDYVPRLRGRGAWTPRPAPAFRPGSAAG